MSRVAPRSERAPLEEVETGLGVAPGAQQGEPGGHQPREHDHADPTRDQPAASGPGARHRRRLGRWLPPPGPAPSPNLLGWTTPRASRASPRGSCGGLDTMCSRRLRSRAPRRRGATVGPTPGSGSRTSSSTTPASVTSISAPPTPGHFRAASDLLPEQQRVYDLAARWYLQLFADGRGAERRDRVRDAGRGARDPPGRPGRTAGRARLGRPGAPPPPARAGRDPGRPAGRGRDPLRDPAPRVLARGCAAAARRRRPDPRRVGLARRRRRRRAPRARRLATARVEVIRARTADPRAVAGIECGWCPFIAGCGAHPAR